MPDLLKHGADGAGKLTGGPFRYDPYGQALSNGLVSNQAVPDNSNGSLDAGWVGSHQRPYEHAGTIALKQMGARPYIPSLGRFTALDPLEGGNANDYIYPTDPVNGFDLDGRRCWFGVDHTEPDGTKIAWLEVKGQVYGSASRNGIKIRTRYISYGRAGSRRVSEIERVVPKDKEICRDVTGRVRKVEKSAAIGSGSAAAGGCVTGALTSGPAAPLGCAVGFIGGAIGGFIGGTIRGILSD